MPKSTNDSDEKKVTKRVKKVDDTVKEIKNKSTKKSTTKSSTKKSSTTRTKLKADEKSKTSNINKSAKTPKSSKKSTTSKKVSDKSTSSKNKKTTETKIKTTKTAKTTKKTTSSKSKTASTKKVTSTTRTRKSSKKEEILTSLEYYDLPYRYNQTIVKILAQTPNTLFVYWDISDEDRKNLEETYGNEFFSNTKPVLIIHNETKDYSFEIDINDFANSWYLNISDTDCKYNIELGRRFINNNVISNDNNQTIYNNLNDYIYISSSNELVTPNDHILLSNFKNNHVQFKNIKNNTYFFKEIKHEQFDKLYSEEILKDLPFNNPSSSYI